MQPRVTSGHSINFNCIQQDIKLVSVRSDRNCYWEIMSWDHCKVSLLTKCVSTGFNQYHWSYTGSRKDTLKTWCTLTLKLEFQCKTIHSFIKSRSLELTVNPALWANRQLSFLEHIPPIPFVFVYFDMCSPHVSRKLSAIPVCFPLADTHFTDDVAQTPIYS